MDAIYYISAGLMIPTFIGLLVALVLFLVKPHLLQKSKHINKPISRVAIFGIGIAVLLVAFIGYGSVLAATEPVSVRQERLAREDAEMKAKQKAKEAAEARKPTVKTETKTEVFPFESIEQSDNTLAKGQSRVATEGVNGERAITYEVTSLQGRETSRREVKNEIIKAPITKVTQIGTYIAPPPSASVTPTPAPQVQSTTRTGAVCNDGSSSNATGRGACSHHGGVAHWLYG